MKEISKIYAIKGNGAKLMHYIFKLPHGEIVQFPNPNSDIYKLDYSNAIKEETYDISLFNTNSRKLY